MEIVCNAKHSYFFLVLLLPCLVPSAAQLSNCDFNNSRSAQFVHNWNTVTRDLVKNASSPSSDGFSTSMSGQSPDTVYGLLQCYGGTTMNECFACSQNATTTIRHICREVRGGKLWLDKCYIRYDVHSFFGKLDTDSRTLKNTQEVSVADKPDVFRAAVKELFTNLSALLLLDILCNNTGMYPVLFCMHWGLGIPFSISNGIIRFHHDFCRGGDVCLLTNYLLI